MPNSHFMSKENHLIFWVDSIILTLTQGFAFFYYTSSSDFEPNPQPKVTFSHGWNGVCKSSTANFLIVILIFTLLPIFIYRSAPWKEPFYKNIVLLILILLDLGAIICMYLFTSQLSIIDLLPIRLREAIIMFGITTCGCMLCGVANLVINRY